MEDVRIDISERWETQLFLQHLANLHIHDRVLRPSKQFVSENHLERKKKLDLSLSIGFDHQNRLTNDLKIIVSFLESRNCLTS